MTVSDIPIATPKVATTPYYTMRDICTDDVLDPNYLVKGLLPKETLACVWGAPGCGKTFWVIALNVAIASPSVHTFHGQKVRHFNTLYCALEGGNGIKKRLQPYLARYADESGVHIYDNALDLRTTEDDADAVIAMANRIGNVGLVTIDTYSRALNGGNENGSEDSGAFQNQCERIIRETGTTVLAVHHPGKDASKGMRGHTSFIAAVDTSLRIQDFNGARKLTVIKQKDGPAGDEFGFQLDVHSIGTDTDGDEVTTCEIRMIDAPAVKSDRLSDRQQLLLDCIYESLKKHGEKAPPDVVDNNPGIMKVTQSVTTRDLASARVYAEMNGETRRQAWRRDIAKLSRAGRIGVWNDWIFIPA